MALKAKPGMLRLVNSDNALDPFPAEMRKAIDKVVGDQGLRDGWHIELSIHKVEGNEVPKGRVRFKHNFPIGMRESIRQILDSDDWCLQMKLRDGDGEHDHAEGDDDGTARVGPREPRANRTQAKAIATSSSKVTSAARKTTGRPASRSGKKSPRKTSRKGNKQ